MSEAIVTLAARKKMVRARAGIIELPPIAGMAFGTGGVDKLGNPIAPTSDAEGLMNEVYRKVVDDYIFVDDITCRYVCTLATNECVNEQISEIGLYDSEGDILVIKTFKVKNKDSDLEMTFQIDDIF